MGKCLWTALKRLVSGTPHCVSKGRPTRVRFSCVAFRSVPIRHDTSDVRHDASAVRRDPSVARQPCGAMRLDPFRCVFDAAQSVTTRMEGVGIDYGFL